MTTLGVASHGRWLALRDRPPARPSFRCKSTNSELTSRTIETPQTSQTTPRWPRRTGTTCPTSDIINHSFITSDIRDGSPELQDYNLGNWSPAYWAAFTQRDAQEKTIQVWGAGNWVAANDPKDRPSIDSSLPAREPAVRGHWLAVAAAEYGNRSNDTNDSPLRIAFYSNHCGPLPGDWNPQAHGRHYCLTAPGTLRVAYPNFNPETDPDDADASVHWEVGGTSLSAPIVAGGIALVMERFRGQLSNREVALRVVNTANNRGLYSDSRIYGAGLLDLDAATAPVGEVSTGTASMQAALVATRLATPPAWATWGHACKASRSPVLTHGTRLSGTRPGPWRDPSNRRSCRRTPRWTRCLNKRPCCRSCAGSS